MICANTPFADAIMDAQKERCAAHVVRVEEEIYAGNLAEMNVKFLQSANCFEINSKEKWLMRGLISL